MEIKAKCVLDREAAKAFSDVMLYRKAEPRKALLTRMIISLVMIAVIVCEFCLIGVNRHVLILFATGVVLILLWLILCCISPKKQYQAFGKLQDAENRFVFGDSSVKVSTVSSVACGESEIDYSIFIKAYETSVFIFLYQTNRQVFIIDKRTVEGGSSEELRSKLQGYLGSKYILCRY